MSAEHMRMSERAAANRNGLRSQADLVTFHLKPHPRATTFKLTSQADIWAWLIEKHLS